MDGQTDRMIFRNSAPQHRRAMNTTVSNNHSIIHSVVDGLTMRME